MSDYKGPGKRGRIVADTLFPTQMFPHLPARATFVADTNFVSGTQKMFLILFRNILCPKQMFPSLRSPRNIINSVSATMCPRLPGPLTNAGAFKKWTAHQPETKEISGEHVAK